MNYLKNKMKRLKTKYSNILMRDFGIEMSDSVTETLVICNGGLCNGITREMVCNTFETFGDLESVIMVPGKSYCFVKFSDSSNASDAFNKINGEKVWPEIKGPIYLGFVQNISSSLASSSNFKKPPGLVLIEDFVTEEEEKFILELVGLDSGEDNITELKHRKVKHYGYEFKYLVNNVDLNESIQKIPKELNFLWVRLKECESGINFIPDQLTVNCYEPGQGIPPHVDTHSAFEDGILSLSLESTVVMDFKGENNVTYNVVLPRRSLCIMLAESRYDWTHGITPRKSDVVPNSKGWLTVQNRQRRTSLTFRKTRKGDCTCKYPRLCDSVLRNHAGDGISDLRNISLKKEVSSELERNYVHEVYEKIASHFSETRQKPWPNVMKFVKSFDVGSILVDIGCGNGKYFSKQSERFEVGCDSSRGLLELCREQGFECLSCNCLSIPIRDNVADGCICIAVIHHLTTDARRRQAIKEIIRILKSKGRALIYVWAKNQEKDSKNSSYLRQCTKKERKGIHDVPDVKLVSLDSAQEKLLLPVHVNRTNFNHNDLLVPWKLKTKDSDSKSGPVHLRYYHVYEDGELEDTCRELEGVDILDSYYDQGNWAEMEANPCQTIEELSNSLNEPWSTIRAYLKQTGEVSRAGVWVPHDLSGMQLIATYQPHATYCFNDPRQKFDHRG